MYLANLFGEISQDTLPVTDRAFEVESTIKNKSWVERKLKNYLPTSLYDTMMSAKYDLHMYNTITNTYITDSIKSWKDASLDLHDTARRFPIRVVTANDIRDFT